VLPAEQELQERLKALSPKKHELKQASKQREEYDRSIDNKRALLQQAIAEHHRLALLATQTSNSSEYAAIVRQANVLATQIQTMADYVQDSTFKDQISKRVGAAGDALYTELRGLRVLVDKTQSRYAELALDADVGAALGKIADSTGRTPKLGPRPIFEKNIAELARHEASIRSAEIKLRPDGGVFWVDAVLNGTTSAEFVLDTGASTILLPTDLAKRAGVTPSESDPTVRMQVASGDTIEGRMVFLNEVRVGEFVVKNVEAVIIPEGAGKIPPLLGGSFLRHFTIDLNQAAKTVKLTQVTAPPAGDAGAP
jgi:clan AA aspartic protease (TIGR02281 family)